MKKRILLALFAAVLATVMLVTSVSAASVDEFTDKDTWPNWAKDSISYVIENGLMNGTGDGKFTHKGDITRAQFALMLYNLETAVYGEPEVADENPFTDVADGKWFTTAIKWAAQSGIVTGTNKEGTLFNPNGKINNGAMAVMLYRYVNYVGATDILDITRIDESITPVESFYEDMVLGEWLSSQYFFDAAIFCGNAGLLIGSPSDDPDFPLFNVDNTSTRGQGAVILTRLHKFLTIPTLDAEVALAEFDETYNSCAHPGSVYFLYGKNGTGRMESSEMNQSLVQSYNGKYLLEMIDEAINYDRDKWDLVVDDLAELAANFKGKENGHANDATFRLVLKSDPSISLERTVHLSMQQQSLGYFAIYKAYGTRTTKLLPSDWHCHERKANYAADIDAYVEAEFKEWTDAYVKDGKITILVDDNIDLADDWWNVYGLLNRTLYMSYEALGNNGDIGVIIFDQLDGDEIGGIGEWIVLDYHDEEEDEDVYKWSDAWNKVVADYNANGTASYKETVTGVYATSRNVYSEETIEKFGGAENVPMAASEIEVVLVKDTNTTAMEGSLGVVKPVAAAADVTLDALGDFYCAECGSINIVAGQNWGWGQVWYNSGNDDDHWAGKADTTWTDFLLKMIQTHAGAHMDIHNYTITGLEMTAEAEAAAQTAANAHGNAPAYVPAKIYVAKTGDANSVALDVNLYVTYNHHIAGPEFDWVDGEDENDNEGWDIVTGFPANSDTGNGAKMGNHFGHCKHTDPDLASGAILDNMMAPYYCELHDCIHLNTHNAGDITDAKIREDRGYLLGLFWDYNNGSWTKRYNEGLLKITNFSNAIGEGKLPVNADGIVAPKIVIGLKGHYDQEYDYRIYNVQFTCDTENPNTGVVPAVAVLHNVATGETKSLCASTTEYKEFLAACDKAEEAELDKQLAAYLTTEGGTVYYNPSTVFGHWDIGFLSQTVLENTDLTDQVLRRMGGNDAARFDNKVDFTGVFTHKDNGQWTWAEDMDGNKVEDGVATKGTFPITVYLNSTGRAVTRNITVNFVCSWLVDGTTTEKPATTHADVEKASEEKVRAAIAEFTKSGVPTIYYNCEAPENESWTFGEVVGNAIAASTGLVCDPNMRYNLPGYATNDYHTVRLAQYNGAWTFDPSVMANGWDIDNGAVACDGSKAVKFEWLLPRAYGTQKSIVIDINVKLIRDTGLDMNTASLTPSGK